MFGPLGAMEILFILVLALLIFGPRRLPEVGRTIGKALGEFRRATTDLKRTVNTELALEEDEDRPRTGRRPPPFPSTAAETPGIPSPTVVRSAAGAHPRSPHHPPEATAGEEPEPRRPAGDRVAGGEVTTDPRRGDDG